MCMVSKCPRGKIWNCIYTEDEPFINKSENNLRWTEKQKRSNVIQNKLGMPEIGLSGE